MFVTYLDLQHRLHELPFKAFRIRLLDGRSLDVTGPRRVTVGEKSAIVVTETRKVYRGYEVAMDWTTISIPHITEFSDIETRRRKRRPK